MEKEKTQTYETTKQPEVNEPTPEVRSLAVDTLAGEFHEDWRKTRLDENGAYEPRIKSTKDEAWIANHGTDQVDIANSAYLDLPSDWQAENKAAAGVIVDIMHEYNGNVNLSDKEIRSAVGDKVHTAWLSRNEWAKGGELDTPFDELSQVEQDKDIDQVVVAQRVFSAE